MGMALKCTPLGSLAAAEEMTQERKARIGFNGSPRLFMVESEQYRVCVGVTPPTWTLKNPDWWKQAVQESLARYTNPLTQNRIPYPCRASVCLAGSTSAIFINREGWLTRSTAALLSWIVNRYLWNLPMVFHSEITLAALKCTTIAHEWCVHVKLFLIGSF